MYLRDKGDFYSARVLHSEGKALIFQWSTWAAPAVLFATRSETLYRVYLSLECILSHKKKNPPFSPCPSPPPFHYSCKGHKIKIFTVAAGNTDVMKRQSTADKWRCLEGWFDELKGREGGQTVSRYIVVHWSYLCFKCFVLASREM